MNGTDKKTSPVDIVRARLLSAERTPVTIFAALFIIAAVFLFIRVDRGLDPDRGKDWWTLSFESRDPASIAFTVENHSEGTEFTYTVSHAGMEIASGDMSVRPGGKETASPDFPAVAGRTTVTVGAPDGTVREIYRER